MFRMLTDYHTGVSMLVNFEYVVYFEAEGHYTVGHLKDGTRIVVKETVDYIYKQKT